MLGFFVLGSILNTFVGQWKLTYSQTLGTAVETRYELPVGVGQARNLRRREYHAVSRLGALGIVRYGAVAKGKKGRVAVETVKTTIGGNPIIAEVEEELEVLDPATGELLGRVPLSGVEDVDRAVQAAARAFEEWREEPVTRRALRLFNLQVLLEEHMEELLEDG